MDKTKNNWALNTPVHSSLAEITYKNRSRLKEKFLRSTILGYNIFLKLSFRYFVLEKYKTQKSLVRIPSEWYDKKESIVSHCQERDDREKAQKVTTERPC